MSSLAFKLPEVQRPSLPQGLSPEEYLAHEELAFEKSEYAAGSMVAMAGATETHELISMNLTLILGNHLRGKPCRVFKSDMKLRVKLLEEFFYYYPDLMVSCDPEDKESPLFKERPLVLVEVLSASSRERDVETKVFAYTAIPSLRSYVILSQDRPEIRHYQRTADGWSVSLLAAPDAVLDLPELGLQVPVADIYDRTGVGQQATA